MPKAWRPFAGVGASLATPLRQKSKCSGGLFQLQLAFKMEQIVSFWRDDLRVVRRIFQMADAVPEVPDDTEVVPPERHFEPENRDWFMRKLRGAAGSAASLGRENHAHNSVPSFRGQGWPHSRRKASRSQMPIAVFRLNAGWNLRWPGDRGIRSRAGCPCYFSNPRAGSPCYFGQDSRATSCYFGLCRLH